ncbi:MAG: linear amide C-N hydrolase [Bacteroidales bacterium]|jgi:hypothetical protein|nr:linear amide C-N hydrolase [Bacteroidales bacterium]
MKIFFIFLVFTLMMNAQEERFRQLGSGSDLSIYDSLPMSMHLIEKAFVDNTEVVFSPAGMKRSSQSDVKRRYSYGWESKYNTIYFRTHDGIVYEGMNEHGFSASLIYLQYSQLPEKEKVLIPIAASLAVNFFIDHFKCIDTALLAIWDIRIYDDLGFDGRWPFRIVLHDTSGASAYVEYIQGSRQVYTPDNPALVVAGPDYTRLIKLVHLPEEIPETNIEALYSDLQPSLNQANAPLILLQHYMKYFGDKEYYSFFRYPRDKEIIILTPEEDEAAFNFNEAEFIPGKEITTGFF